MTSFPNSHRLQKGAIIGLDPFNPLASVIIFQYNPDTMTRTITPRYEALVEVDIDNDRERELTIIITYRTPCALWPCPRPAILPGPWGRSAGSDSRTNVTG